MGSRESHNAGGDGPGGSTIAGVIHALTGARLGTLMMLLGVFMTLFSVVDSAMGIQLVANAEMRDKLFEAGLVLAAFGAVLSYNANQTQDRTERQSWLDQNMDQIFKTLEAFGAKIEDVVKEVKPNGGTSLRDSFDRIEVMTHAMNQRQLALIDDMDKGVFEAGPDGLWSRVNPYLCDVVGRRREQLLDAGWISAVDLAHRSQAHIEWESAVSQRRDFEMRLSFLSLDGTVTTCDVRAQRLADYRGETAGYVGTVVEIDHEDESQNEARQAT